MQCSGAVADPLTGFAALSGYVFDYLIQSIAQGKALGREQLDLLLLDAAARVGASLWQPWSAVKLQRSSRGHACTIVAKQGRHELGSRVVIVANGSWERTVFTASNARAHGCLA